MKWRVLGWLTFLLSLSFITIGALPFLIPGIGMTGVIEWDFVPAQLVAPLWYCQYGAFLLPAGIAFGFASFSFFAKWRGENLGLSYLLYVTLSLMLGLSYTGCLVVLSNSGYFPIGRQSSMSVEYSSIWWGVGFTALVLSPAFIATFAVRLDRAKDGCPR